MNLGLIIEMVTAAGGDRPVVTHEGRTLTATQLAAAAYRAGARFRGRPAVLYLGTNHLAYPVALFGAALAGVPFVPVNYRLSKQQLEALCARHPGAEILRTEDLDTLIHPTPSQEPAAGPDVVDTDDVAAVIYTSGTTAEPKAAVLRHRHLMAYLFNTVDFGSAEPGDAALVSVPPYHIAGLTNLLSNLYGGRRVVYATTFDPARWLDTVRSERITHALLVPTMLARVVTDLDGNEAHTPTLRNLAYGGARTPRPVLEKALNAFPGTGFVNAYGLTETASSVAVLGPDDHREAQKSDDPKIRDRLGSVGRPLPGIEFQIRSEAGQVLAPGETGLVFVRGEQISGEYGSRRTTDVDGWFATRDLGRVDAGGYLFIEGRADDTIIRGGENIAPAEIEDVILEHPAVVEAAVVGAPDPEWGQRIVAFVVGDAEPAEIRAWVRDRLRSSKTPDAVEVRRELPRTETGKLLRRNLLAELEISDA